MARSTTPSREALWTKAGPVETDLENDELEAVEEERTVTVGQPVTLGLWSFATGTWIVGTVVAGIFPPVALVAAAPLLIVFAGMSQFIAGLIGFRRADTLAGTAFCAFGSFNVAAGFAFLLQGVHLAPVVGIPVVMQGYLLLSFGFIAFLLTAAAARLNLALLGVLLTLGIGYTLAGIPEVSGSLGKGALGQVGYVGGFALIASAGIAYYMGTALVINTTMKRTLLPIWGEL